ncbi:hypothetical protein [Lawsonibacter celer]|jgi:phage gp46-like protein|uniref:hypothetical protein n=1 Tax=Lawsonibacter celer TaxID=2986526 RepID=UPI00164493BA|nr:hypothetical protein [Lawsonibacter celer]
MELMVRGGDYLPDGRGGFRRAEGDDELLQRVLWKLSVRRGSFPFLPELGSRLYLLGREKPSLRQALARQYAAEALADEEGLSVTGAELGGDGTLKITIQRRGETAEVELSL